MFFNMILIRNVSWLAANNAEVLKCEKRKHLCLNEELHFRFIDAYYCFGKTISKQQCGMWMVCEVFFNLKNNPQPSQGPWLPWWPHNNNLCHALPATGISLRTANQHSEHCFMAKMNSWGRTFLLIYKKSCFYQFKTRALGLKYRLIIIWEMAVTLTRRIHAVSS